jgi:hypothetical protein
MPPGATSNADVTVPGARRGDFADASLDTSSIAFVLDCHVWSNDKVRVTARNVSLSTVDLPAAGLHGIHPVSLSITHISDGAFALSESFVILFVTPIRGGVTDDWGEGSQYTRLA